MHIHFFGEPDDGVTTSSHHARALAGAGAEVSFSDPPFDVPSDTIVPDFCHVVTFGQFNTRLLRTLTAARIAGVSLVRYWCGRDLLWAKFHPPSRDFALALTKLGALQLARSEKLAAELRESLGIEATVLPVLSLNLSNLTAPVPLPDRFTILSRLPSKHREFYGGAIIDALIARFRTVRFIVLEDESTDYSAFPNVESLGRIDEVARAINRSTVLVQPRMDGQFSRLALEVLSHGRYVIGTHAAPCFIHADTPSEYASAISRLRADPVFQLSARELACRHHDRGLAVKAFWDVLEEAQSNKNWGSNVRGAVHSVSALIGGPAFIEDEDYTPPNTMELPDDAVAFKALLRGTDLDPGHLTGLESSCPPQ